MSQAAVGVHVNMRHVAAGVHVNVACCRRGVRLWGVLL